MVGSNALDERQGGLRPALAEGLLCLAKLAFPIAPRLQGGAVELEPGRQIPSFGQGQIILAGLSLLEKRRGQLVVAAAVRIHRRPQRIVDARRPGLGLLGSSYRRRRHLGVEL